jgi:predicted metal-binding membrane protein
MRGEVSEPAAGKAAQPPGTAPGSSTRERRADQQRPLVLALVLVSAAAWWVTVELSAGMATEMATGPIDGVDRMDGMHGMDETGTAAWFAALGAFLVGWVAMMAAMMLPAVAPAVRLYARAAGTGRVVPVAWFVAGYLTVWTLSGLPAFVLWEWISTPLRNGEPWALRVAAATLLAAGVYQVLPLKRACLKHCRSPMSYFMRSGVTLSRPLGAVRSGAGHGVVCLGCCVGLMAVLVAVVAMQPWWAAALAAVVFVERNVRGGERFALAFAAVLTVTGTVALVWPAVLAGAVQGV